MFTNYLQKMFGKKCKSKISCVVVVLALMFHYSTGWIMNEVDFPTLRGKGLLTEEYNEVDTEGISDLKFSLIYPGTKWCGAGNIADGYDDLGPARETDKCCREHDLCTDIISAGETRHNLTNDAFYTRLSCDCDEQFRQCLHNAHSKVATQIGTVYFNALGTECFREDYPVVGCNRRGGWLNRKCLEPKYDTEGERRYQWFDVPNY